MKQYRNSERTKKWIREAFVELLYEKKSIEKITITELVSRADITKTTFYYHYSDIYAVAEEFENELIEKLNQTLEQVSKDHPKDFSKYIKNALTFLKENEKTYKLVINSSDLNIFTSKLKLLFYKKILSTVTNQYFSKNNEKRAVQAYFIASACVDTTIQYLKGDLSSSIDLVGEVILEAIEKLSSTPASTQPTN